MDYITAASNLRAFMYGIQGTRDLKAIRELVEKVEVPVFVPKSGVKIAITDAEAQASNSGLGLS